MRRLLLLILLTFSVLSAQDKTPYKFVFGGNSYFGPRNTSVTWLAERYDVGIAGLADWPGLHDSIFDTAASFGKDYWAGPYASSQEINLFDRFNPDRSYNERLTDISNNWLYIYAKHYLDSIGISVESLVVHVDDDHIAISQHGDEFREYSLSGLPYHKTRFTYQYWNNTASDTMFYPAGYVWLANGYNPDARRAIAYAYRRHLIEDSVAYGPGDHHWTAYFMDNQYRGGFAPRLYSYYTIYTASGGPTNGLDWVEQPGIGDDINANLTYYGSSTMLIDSTIKAVLDSTCNAKGLDRIHGFANVDKFSAEHLGFQLNYTNVNLENPVDYSKAWPSGWEQWYAIADTMARHPERYINWLFLGDFLCSSDPGDWRYDSSRIYMTHYAFFLQVRDTNAFCGPARFNDSTRWRNIYEADLGEPDGPAYETGSVGSGYDKIAVMRRDYGNGSVAVLLRTSHGLADWVNDSIAVNMGRPYREIDVYGDTSVVAKSIFYLKPYMGKILITSDSCGMPPSAPVPVSPASGSAVSLTPTLCAANSNHGNCPDPVSYRFQISENSGFTAIVRQSGWITEGSGSTCYFANPALGNGRRYYWRCQAFNGTVTSGWSSVYNFTTPNTPPPAPIADSPGDQALVDSLQPTLIVNDVMDPNGTPVVYYFQVSQFSNFSYLAAFSGGISGGGLISWRVGTLLENGTTYYWRVRAFDGISYGNWMNSRSFAIDAPVLENHIRGDINTNGVAYEVADAVMFSNYFISGLSVFGNHVEASIASSDANADGMTLSLADLVHLVRVLAGDALPYPKIMSEKIEAIVNFRVDQSTLTISTESPVVIGAAYILLEHPDYIIGQPILDRSARHMSLKHGNKGELLKLLIFSFDKNRVISSGVTKLLTLPLGGNGTIKPTHIELVDYFGKPIEVVQSKVTTIPKAFALYQNRPNPFNATTAISYELPVAQHVRLEIYNISGQKVAVLVDDYQSAGLHQITWNGTDTDGQTVASGIFIYRLTAGNFSDKKKMILLK